MFGKRRIKKPGRTSYTMPQETKDKISDAVKLSKNKNKPIKEPIKRMRLFDYIQKNKGTAYKKGDHRDVNYTVNNKQAPTTRQACHPKWKVK